MRGELVREEEERGLREGPGLIGYMLWEILRGPPIQSLCTYSREFERMAKR